jgi:hypothetical protein
MTSVMPLWFKMNAGFSPRGKPILGKNTNLDHSTFFVLAIPKKYARNNIVKGVNDHPKKCTVRKKPTVITPQTKAFNRNGISFPNSSQYC